MIPHRNILKPCEVNLSNKTVSNIISIFLELLGFDDLIGFKSMWKKNVMILMSHACGMGGELGSKTMGFGEKTALMTATMFGKQGCVRVIYWKPVALMLTRLMVWMSFCTSFCC